MLMRLVHTVPQWYLRLELDGFVLGAIMFWIFALGCCLGSFLNVCIWRIPLGESIADAPSHCTKCGYEIRWYDNIPLISYLVLRGHCRNCHAPYSCRYFIVELLTGILFLTLFWKIGACGMYAGTMMLYFPMTLLCVTTAWIDAEHRIIPDLTTYPAMGFAIASSLLFPECFGCSSRWYALGAAIGAGVIAGGLLLLFRAVGNRIAKADVLGLGDVKFMTACAMLLGLPGAFFTLLSGSLFSIAYGIVLSVRSRESLRKTAIPFGPFLAAAAVVWMYAGDWILKSYLAIFMKQIN